MKKLAILVFSLLPFILFSQQNSVLSSGDWYKLAIEETGVYKITYNDLQDYGIDVDNIDPRNLALFGNPSGMLHELLEEPYYTDLQPMAVQVVGEDDGVFDPQDYILLFAEGSVIWEYDNDRTRFYHIPNLYTEKTNYFLTVLDEAGKRVQIQQNETLPYNKIIDTLDLLIYHENELVNPEKSGKVWLGELFDRDLLQRSFVIDLQEYQLFPDGHRFFTRIMARSIESTYFNLSINSIKFDSVQINGVGSNNYQSYRKADFDSTFNVSENALTVEYIFLPANEYSKGWLDFFDLNLKTKPIFTGGQMPFRSSQNVGDGNVSYYTLNNSQPNELEIWNVTDPLNVSELDLTIENDLVSFRIKNDSLLEFHVFDGSTFYSAEFLGAVENQNLHAFNPTDLLIITHPDFLAQANQLALFHETEDEMSVGTFTTNQIYNEFSSGTQDVTAIRNFVRYLREQSGDEEKPKYLLLFGDASYDYLDRVENNTNFVPTHETWESSNIVNSFPTDDYFALKNPGTSENVKLGIGRLPVKTSTEADIIMSKIENYSAENSLSPAKNEWLFIGDDGDANRHLKDAEILTQFVDTNNPVGNTTKCYFDFFELHETEEGPHYPDANKLINNKVNKGVFYVNYTGHGSATFMAHEKVLSKDDVEAWIPNDLLSLWVAATCDMAYYDNPDRVSLAEAILLKQNAGAISFIGGSRPTFASANLQMNISIIEKLADTLMQPYLRFGDLARYYINRTNEEKWVLLGDPALKIQFPEYKVKTMALNNIPIQEYSDTIPPGSYLTFQGEILSKYEGSLQSGFNGTVYLKVFAPIYIKTTRANQYGSIVQDIKVQDSVLIEGTASVENGKFEIKVKLPTNYFEGFGNLKLSWYAENGETDANGYYNQLLFGGDPDAIADGDEFLDQIKVYPTVFTDQLNIEFPPSVNKTVVYRVYNNMGVEVYSQESTSTNGIENFRIPGFAKGMYILKVDVAANSRNFKVFRY